MQTGASVLQKLNSIKQNSESAIYNRNKGVMTGALIGVAGGMLLGLVKGYSLVGSAMTGAVIGGLAAYLLLPKGDGNEETEE